MMLLAAGRFGFVIIEVIINNFFNKIIKDSRLIKIAREFNKKQMLKGDQINKC